LTARAFVARLLSAVERKNCRWLAQQAGHRSPPRVLRPMGEAVWDAEAVRDDVRVFGVEQLAHPDAVPICDETGFLTRGRASARRVDHRRVWLDLVKLCVYVQQESKVCAAVVTQLASGIPLVTPMLGVKSGWLPADVEWHWSMRPTVSLTLGACHAGKRPRWVGRASARAVLVEWAHERTPCP